MIFGSCVSRDTKEFFPPSWQVGTYIARQSFISAGTGTASLPGESQLSSPFQNRMVKHDIEGAGLSILWEELPDHDLLLIDLVDERHGVHEITPGEYVTRTDEMLKSRLLKQQDEYPRLIQFGTDEHFELWTRAAKEIHSVVNPIGIPTVCVAPAWASVDTLGKEVRYKEEPVSQINAHYERYLSVISDMGVPLATVPHNETVTDVNHRWGRSTFHFTSTVYQKLRDQILKYYDSQ